MSRTYQRFLAKNRNKGIPNLMLILGLANAFLYLFTFVTQSTDVYELLRFDIHKIFRGQIWRAVTWLITYGVEAFFGSVLGFIYMAFYVLFTRWLGQLLEAVWGTLRLNIYYLGGAALYILVALLCGLLLSENNPPSVYYLNLSLFLAVATLIPEERVLLFGLIPIKMRWLAWIDLALILLELLGLFTYIGTGNFGIALLLVMSYPLLSVVNYLLTFGKDAKNLLPLHRSFAQRRKRMNFQKATRTTATWTSTSSSAGAQRPCRHKCTVCGRTDVDSPGLEFRYCSRCKGFYCYCIDHINNHAHIE